ncbi:MAG: oligosaccharide flippase family protein [bacterium]
MTAISDILRGLRAIRQRLGPLWWYSALLFCTTRVGDVLNLYTGLFVLPGVLSVNDLGAVEPVTRLAGLGAIPLGIVGIVGAKYISAYHAAGEDGKIRHVMRDMLLLSLGSFMVFMIVLRLLYAPVCLRLHLSSPYLFAGLSGLALLACFQPVMGVLLQGMQRFRITAVAGLADPVLRLTGTLLLAPLFQICGYLFALLAAGVTSFCIGAWGLRTTLGGRRNNQSYYADGPEILRFALPVSILVIVGTFQGFVEPFVIKHFLSAQDSAGYYVACRFGYIPGYLVGSVGFVLLPLLSFRHERGDDTGAYAKQALLITIGVSAAGTVIIGLAAAWLLQLRQEWLQYLPYAPQVWKVGVITTLGSAISIYTTHELACRRLRFLWVIVPVTILEAACLYGCFGLAAFAHFLPAATMDALANLPRTLSFALWVMIATRGAILLGMLGQEMAQRRATS